MKRRYFLGSLAVAPAALPLANPARGAARAGDVQDREAVRELLIQEDPVAGFQYHDGESVWSRLSLAAPARAGQPARPAGGRSVLGDAKLGYVPRVANTAVSQMMDRGERLTARVEYLRESRNPWKRVGISIAAEHPPVLVVRSEAPC